MIVLVVVVGAGLVGGFLGALSVGVWPRWDVDAPRVGAVRSRELVRRHRHLGAVLRRDVDPAVASSLVLGAAFLVVVVVSAVLGVVLLATTSDEVTGRTDDPVASWAAEHSAPWAADVIGHLSELGSAWGVVVLAVVVVVVEVRRTPSWAIPAFVALTVGGQFAVVYTIKAIVDRARPDVLQLGTFVGASFPSGHAAAAAASYACFALLLGRRRSPAVRALLAGLATGMAVAVAATRVALGVHWTTDVLAGLVLGWGWFALCSIAFGGRRLRFGEPVHAAEPAAGSRGPEADR